MWKNVRPRCGNCDSGHGFQQAFPQFLLKAGVDPRGSDLTPTLAAVTPRIAVTSLVGAHPHSTSMLRSIGDGR
jgi:hypothetical protein